MVISYLIRLIILVAFATLGAGKNNCPVRKCRHHGPAIRFPFWLKDDHHPDHCVGYPEFGLSCTQAKDTMLELQFPAKASLPNQTKLPFLVKFLIKEIDYKSQWLLISKVDGCLPALLPKLNLSASPFNFLFGDNLAFFNCSSKRSSDDLIPIPCLSSPSYQVYAVKSYWRACYLPLLSCSKMFSIPSVPSELFDLGFPPILTWSEPTCGLCEVEGKSCRFKDNRETLDIKCFDNGSNTGRLVEYLLTLLCLWWFLIFSFPWMPSTIWRFYYIGIIVTLSCFLKKRKKNLFSTMMFTASLILATGDIPWSILPWKVLVNETHCILEHLMQCIPGGQIDMFIPLYFQVFFQLLYELIYLSFYAGPLNKLKHAG